MKITKKKLEKIIKEEINAVLDEEIPDEYADRDYYASKAKEERKKKMAKLKAAREALTDVATQIDKGSYGSEQSKERIKSKEKFLEAEVARLEKELGLRNEQMTPDEAADATFDFRDELESKGHGCVYGHSEQSQIQYEEDLEKHGDKVYGALVWWCGNSLTAQKARKKHEHYPGWDELTAGEKFAVKLQGDITGLRSGRGSIAQAGKNIARNTKADVDALKSMNVDQIKARIRRKMRRAP